MKQLFFSDHGLPGKVMFSTFLGDFVEYEINIGKEKHLIVNEYTKDSSTVHESGEDVFLNFDPARISIYDSQSEELITC